MKTTPLVLALIAGASSPALAQNGANILPPVDVEGAAIGDAARSSAITGQTLRHLAPASSDVGAILTRLPGLAGNTMWGRS